MDTSAGPELVEEEAKGPPPESLGRLFLRFLRFGLLAWGGPVAQIAMVRQELAEEEGWVSRARFNRILGVYQVLPGPEAHELCVHFGMLSRGRVGGLLAGLGFMLPGFVLMFALSWAYVTFESTQAAYESVLRGVQVAVIALIVRACHRIARHALADRWLWIIASIAAAAELLGARFWLTLPAAGLAYVFLRRGRLLATLALGVVLAGATASMAVREGKTAVLFLSGLKAGTLTFGGAYTVIPFLQEDAVVSGAWMSEEQFLDGLGLAGILPAPLIIFATFVGYLGGGPAGAIALTVGVFLPAFALTLCLHDQLGRLVERPLLRRLFDGVTAGVVGLIVATTLRLGAGAIQSGPAGVLFSAALALLYLSSSRFTVPTVVVGAALAGRFLFG